MFLKLKQQCLTLGANRVVTELLVFMHKVPNVIPLQLEDSRYRSSSTSVVGAAPNCQYSTQCCCGPGEIENLG